MLYAFKTDGALIEATADMPQDRWPLFKANASKNSGVDEADILLCSGPAVEHPLAVVSGGAVMAVAPDPNYVPPEPPLDPIEEMKAIISKNLLASAHDKRWLAQKEEAKAEGIPWIKANPTCTQAEAEAAVNGFIATVFPDDPRVVSGLGIILSYASEAHARGIIAAATFEALRDFIVATDSKTLTKLLSKL